MATLKKPPRPWSIGDLLDLGKYSASTYLKAIPVLILEKWLQGDRQEGVANFIRTEDLAKRLESSKLVASFTPGRIATISGALVLIQKGRDLTRPPFIETRGMIGRFWVNLPHYEGLLQDYRREYEKRYPEDYRKLFPEPENEPKWEGPTLVKKRAEREESKPILSKSEIQDDIHGLLAQLEQALRDQQRAFDRLTEKNQALQAELDAKDQQLSFVHTSPDFHNSAYGAKVTSIKDTVGAMLQRARYSIRISTRQMDMFEDELIRLKQSNPDLRITVISRGPEGAAGDRKKLAGVAFERMKEAGIKMLIEKHALHSRMVVIDDQEVLVSSADLDYTQMEKEFNSGIWTNSPDVVADAIGYFDNLLRSPTVEHPK